MAGDPRIRGEHEDKRYADWDRAGSSPHTRGARAHRLLKPSGVCIIPAYAGSTTSSPTRWRRPKDHPRIRGEHNQPDPFGHWTEGSSPHTRGALPEVARRNGEVGIIPAYAGSTQCAGIRLGERSGSSPHTRGAPQARLRRGFRAGIIPAYAGSTVTPATAPGYLPDHPRIRGEHDDVAGDGGGAVGSSPHTRGARFRHPQGPDRCGIIPAYAGSTGGHATISSRIPDHPRIRGEHIVGSIGMVIGWGSSPHTRGAPDQLDVPRLDLRIIPAYAGSTSWERRRRVPAWDHPRIRGEHAPSGLPTR